MSEVSTEAQTLRTVAEMVTAPGAASDAMVRLTVTVIVPAAGTLIGAQVAGPEAAEMHGSRSGPSPVTVTL